MGVAVSTGIYIVPIFRVDETKRPILARWHSICVSAGDGSGGYNNLRINLGLPGDLFQFVTLWDLQQFSYDVSSGTLTSAELLIYPLENSNDAVIPLYFKYWLSTTVPCALSIGPNQIPYKYRMSQMAGTGGTVQLIVQNNAGQVVQFCAGGYIYDERYI